MGYLEVELRKDPAFAPLDSKPQNYYTLGNHTIDHFNPYTTEKGAPDFYHNSNTHRYPVSKTVLNSDAIISVAKLKTHKKAGVTLGMKNMVGIVRDKDSIPHHRSGPPPKGDAFPEYPPNFFVKRRKLKQKLRSPWILEAILVPLVRSVRNLPRLPRDKEPIEWGDWYGNDTIWRTIIDLNKIVVFADKNGKMRDSREQKYLSIIDGIVGMEGNGPMDGKPRKCGIIIGGFDPVAADTVTARIMGFDQDKTKSIEKASESNNYYLGNCELQNIHITGYNASNKAFEPPRGWKGHIER